MPIIKKILFVFILLFRFLGFGQYQVSGQITDTKSEPLFGVNVALYTMDSILYKGGVTDINGAFSINFVEKGEYTIAFSFTGFDTYKQAVTVDSNLVLGKMKLQANTEVLKGVDVIATQALVVQKGDTTEYSASAFKTNIDANIGDLINKIPGLSVGEDGIKADGEEVKKILVDGKPYLGEDGKDAIDALPAYSVSKVQVLDDKTENAKKTGAEDGKREKTINIVTKESFKNAIFGDLTAGYGWKDKYNLDSKVNYYGKKRKIIVDIDANNINKGYFSSKGNNQDLKANFNWTETLDKGELKFRYRANNKRNRTEEDIYRIYQIDTGYQYSENSLSTNTSTNHTLALELEYKLNEKSSISIDNNVYFKYKMDNKISVNNRKFDTVASYINTSSQEELDNLSTRNRMSYTYKIDTNKRSFHTSVSQFYDKSSGRGFNNNQFTINNQNNLTYLDNNQNNRQEDYGFNAGYINPFFKLGTIGLDGNYNYSKKNSLREVTSEGTLQDSLSNKSFTIEENKGLDLFIQLSEIKDLDAYLGLSYTNTRFDNTQELPLSLNRSIVYNNFSGYMYARYQLTKLTRLSANYYQFFNQPTITELSTNLNNSNLLNPTIGNANLKQSYDQYVYGRYNISNKEKTTDLSFRFSYNNTVNNITSISTILLQDSTVNGYVLREGAILNTYANLSGKYGYSVGADYDFTLGIIKSKCTIGTYYMYSQTPTITLDQYDLTQNNLYNMRFKISSNISEKIDFNVQFNPSYNKFSNTLNTAAINEYYAYNMNGKLSYEFPFEIVLKANYNGSINTGYRTNINYHLLGASLGKRIFKNKMGKVEVEVYDALNQNNSLSVGTYPGYIQETRTNVLTRFVMLSFSYKIKPKEDKKEEPEFFYFE